MKALSTVEGFDLLYLHDSLLTSIELRTAEARCFLRFQAAAILRTKRGDMFNPMVRYAPALLTIEGVREVAFEGRYQLNATVVEAEARGLSDQETVEFVFELTGGHDADAYLAKLRIVGGGFSLDPG